MRKNVRHTSLNQKKATNKTNLSETLQVTHFETLKRLTGRFIIAQLIPLSLLLFPPTLLANHQHPCLSHGEENTFIDKTYHYINTQFCQPALWFDDFFMDARSTNDAHAGTMVRWYNDFSWDKNQEFTYKMKFTARINLPIVTEKFKLVFESDREDSIVRLFPTENATTENALGLRYDWVAKERQSLNFKITFKPSAEIRYRYTYPISERLFTTLTQKVYQRKKISGSASLVDLDYALSAQFLLRWSNYFNIETDDKVELGSGFTLYQYISPEQAISYKSSITAQQKPKHYISNYHLSASYRQNILRKWFYYEVTPAINWNQEVNTNEYVEAKITLRLEVLFDNF